MQNIVVLHFIWKQLNDTKRYKVRERLRPQSGPICVAAGAAGGRIRQEIPNHKVVEGVSGLKNCCPPKKNKEDSTPSGSWGPSAYWTTGCTGGYLH